MELNERLKSARTNKGYTQQEVADILHISRTTVSSWEVGRTLPSLAFVVELSNLYDLSLDILLKEDMAMVEQTTKDVKAKKYYKGLLIGIVSTVLLLFTVSVIWLVIVKKNYQYLEKNWEPIQDSFIYREGTITMMAPKFNLKEEVRFSLFRKEPIWIMSYFEEETTSKVSLMFRQDKVFASVPLTKNQSISGDVRIDEKIQMIPDQDNVGTLMMPETIVVVNQFLTENKKELKKLYQATKKQYRLVNQK